VFLAIALGIGAGYASIRIPEADRATIAACQLFPPSPTSWNEANVPTDSIAFGSPVTIRTGDPVSTWTVQVCDPRSQLHLTTELTGTTTNLFSEAMEFDLMVRLDELSGPATSAEIPFVNWEFTSNQDPDRRMGTPGFDSCESNTWDLADPSTFTATTLAVGEVETGRACVVVAQSIPRRYLRMWLQVGDTEIEFSGFGRSNRNLLVDLTTQNP